MNDPLDNMPDMGMTDDKGITRYPNNSYMQLPQNNALSQLANMPLPNTMNGNVDLQRANNAYLAQMGQTGSQDMTDQTRSPKYIDTSAKEPDRVGTMMWRDYPKEGYATSGQFGAALHQKATDYVLAQGKDPNSKEGNAIINDTMMHGMKELWPIMKNVVDAKNIAHISPEDLAIDPNTGKIFHDPTQNISEKNKLEQNKIDATAKAKADADSEKKDAAQTKADDKTWETVIKSANPLTASSRTPLGVAANADLRANRALQTLQNPVITKQEAGFIIGDIAGIFQGGAPHEAGMKEGTYKTAYGDLQGLKQYLTGSPQDAVPDNIKNRLIDVIQKMKDGNSSMFNQQLDALETTHGSVIKKHQEDWDNFRKQVGGGIRKAGSASAAPAQAAPQGEMTKEQFDALPKGAPFTFKGRSGTKK